MNIEFENFVLDCLQHVVSNVNLQGSLNLSKEEVVSHMTDMEFSSFLYGCFIGAYGATTANELLDELTKNNLKHLI